MNLSQPSYDKVIPATFSELGFSELVSVYNELKELGRPPPIIDAAELQKDPEVLLLSDLPHLFSH